MARKLKSERLLDIALMYERIAREGDERAAAATNLDHKETIKAYAKEARAFAEEALEDALRHESSEQWHAP